LVCKLYLYDALPAKIDDQMVNMSAEWTQLAQDSVQWLSIVHTAMKHVAPKKGGDFFTS
jgi:hypothetical protein